MGENDMMAASRPDSQQVCDTPVAAGLQAFFRRLTEPRSLRARSKAEWLQRRAALREAVQAALGLDPFPERVPLEVRPGGALERDGYRIERLYWRVWPRVWAAGRLYRPAGEAGKGRAALLYCGPALAAEEQCLLAALARLGHLALAVDAPAPDEADPAVGLLPLTTATVHHLRALDLLAGLPEVDRERLGVVGIADAADAALYTLALDERPRALVLARPGGFFGARPAAGRALAGPPGLLRATDFTELAAIPSPRAALYLTTGALPGADLAAELAELRAVYRVWGQPDRLAHRHFPAAEAADQTLREAAYAWLARELRGDRDAPPPAEPPVAPEDAETLAGLDAPPRDDEGFAGIRAWFHRRAAAQPPQLESRPARRGYQERLREDLIGLLGGDPPAIPAGAVLEPLSPGLQRLTLHSERDLRLPALYREGSGPPPHRVLVVAHPAGKEAALQLPLAAAAGEAGWAVLAPDVRFRGELTAPRAAACALWGRPEAAQAADDLRACVQWLCGWEEVDWRGITLFGVGDQGIPALLAGALDERVAAVLADCCGSLYRDGGAGLPPLPNILRVADVPQIAALTAPRALWLFRAPAERLGFSSRRYLDWVKRTYQSLGELEALRLTPEDLGEPAETLEWLDARLRRQKKGAHRA
jgi:hypothetical protein